MSVRWCIRRIEMVYRYKNAEVEYTMGIWYSEYGRVRLRGASVSV